MLATSVPRVRADIDDRFKWNLTHIFPDWDGLAGGLRRPRPAGSPAFAALQGTLASGGQALLAALQLAGRHRPARVQGLVLRVAAGTTRISATTRSTRRRQQVQILFAKAAQAAAWFDPELLSIPLATVQQWMTQSIPRSRSTASRSRTSTGSRSTCSTTRASGCCRCRAASRRRRTTPTRRSRPPTSSIRRSRCRTAPRSR